MADYIYLIQNRLTPAQWRALEAIREASRARGMTIFLVGGAVRDLTSGSPVRDLDFAVQGDVAALSADLEAAGTVVSGRNRVLGSVYLTLRGGVRAEVSPTLSVTYPKPGRAETRPATILDDLRRRDFTANAMAVSLNEGSYGLLLDPLNGTADIENRELRLVSNYGFLEQPVLLLRAARLSGRLGWNLEERTQSRYQTGKEEGYIANLPEFDRGYELEEIFHEEDPVSVMEQMEAEGWREVLFPALSPAKVDRNGLDAVRDLVGQLEGQGIHPDPSAVNFPLLTGKLGPKEVQELKQAFVRPGFAKQIESLETRGKELAGQLTSKAAALPSETWKLLFEAEPDVVLWLAFSSKSGGVQAKLKGFLKEWPELRQKVPYALMQEMRITPDLPGYDKLLDDLFFAMIDGKLDTPEATRAFLEPYSPPAPPPQVAVRRRPAKATRSRAKKAVEEPVDAVPEDDAGEEEELEAPAREETIPTSVARSTQPEAAEARGKAPAAPSKAAEPAKAKQAAKVNAVPAKKPSAGKPEPAPQATKVSGKVAEKQASASAKKTVSAAPPAKPAKSSRPAGAAKAVAKKALPAKKSVVKKTAAKKVVSAKKSVPAKKAAAKQPVKGAKKAAAKKTVAKVAPKKAAAKRAAVPPAKRGAAAKKSVKTAAKGRSKR